MTPRLSSSTSLVVLTGAGMSAESGVPTFRGVDGLWEGYKIEEVASPQAFECNPTLVHRFYNMRREALKTVQPNAGHHALARLEKEWPGPFLLVTQNVDDLHERAGSQKLIHMHGELRKVSCTACSSVFPWQEDLSVETACPHCAAVGHMRPHIVWFGEMPLGLDTIFAALARVDLFLCIGTSGVVYPAAGFAAQATKRAGCRLVEMNLESTAISSHFHEHIIGPSAVELPKLVDQWLSNKS